MARRSVRSVGSVVPLLTVWGTSPNADLVYRFLVEHGPSSADSLRHQLGLGRHQLLVAIDELADANAIHPAQPSDRSGTDVRKWRPGPPEQVVAALRERHDRAAQASRNVRSRFGALLDHDHELRVDIDDSVTVRPLHGLSRARARLGELVSAARHEHLSMHPEPAFNRASVQASAPLDDDLVARGVAVKCVGVPPSVEDATAAHALSLVRGGVQYRERSELPAKMILFDRRTAILLIDPTDAGKGVLEVTAPATVERLAQWFLRWWTDAAAPSASPAAGGQLTPRERRIVALLIAGHTDASAATRLGLSERTVTYAVSDVMGRFRVQNRFQLGLVLGAELSSRQSTTNPEEKP